MVYWFTAELSDNLTQLNSLTENIVHVRTDFLNINFPTWGSILLVWSSPAKASGVTVIMERSGTLEITNLSGTQMTASDWTYSNGKLISSFYFLEAVGLKLNYA